MLQAYKEKLPDYAKDLKLNLSSVLNPASDSGLSPAQIASIALASAYATRAPQLIEAILDFANETLDEAGIHATKAAASIMGMNNIYYRFAHLSSDTDYRSMPAQLRMNVIGNPGVEKVDFELASLAVSVINGCGMCIDAHSHALNKAGISKAGIQQTARIAAVLNGLAQVEIIES